jgi:hypothetical protein
MVKFLFSMTGIGSLILVFYIFFHRVMFRIQRMQFR